MDLTGPVSFLLDDVTVGHVLIVIVFLTIIALWFRKPKKPPIRSVEQFSHEKVTLQQEFSAFVRAIAVVAVLVGIGAWYLHEPNGTSRYGSSDWVASSSSADEIGAWAYMQLFVKQHLTSPRTADFPFGGYRDGTYLGNDRYRVASYVDSQNALGATVRTHFTGEIKRVSGGWELISLRLR